MFSYVIELLCTAPGEPGEAVAGGEAQTVPSELLPAPSLAPAHHRPRGRQDTGGNLPGHSRAPAQRPSVTRHSACGAALAVEGGGCCRVLGHTGCEEHQSEISQDLLQNV